MVTWQSRIRDLQKKARPTMTLEEIGDHIGLSTGAVGDIANGRSDSPRGEAALKLHELHKNRCSRKNGANQTAADR